VCSYVFNLNGAGTNDNVISLTRHAATTTMSDLLAWLEAWSTSDSVYRRDHIM